MNLADKDTIQKIFQQYGIKPLESRGQNFLINDEISNKIIASACLSADDVVVEVGPGLGILTRRLATTAKKILAVEIDKKLAALLKKNFKEFNNIEIINEDILQAFSIRSELQGINYKIVANLPYNITSIFLRKFLTEKPGPKEMILMVQKEVAQRICARPGKMSLLSVSVQFYSRPEILFYVPRENFYPRPEVDSAVIKLSVNNTLLTDGTGVSEKEFFKTVKIGFSSRRKQLHNNFSAGFKIKNEAAKELLTRAGLEETSRAQELTLKNWLVLVKLINKMVTP
ncbi:ribosomal RNA small subunit methyltransferase A [Candidatus Parcubacteria bacterium]|nr:MAG: ribosomal RNA small subunit methyltransferase A [Candidatus Parcubacteria bacterium]